MDLFCHLVYGSKRYWWTSSWPQVGGKGFFIDAWWCAAIDQTECCRRLSDHEYESQMGCGCQWQMPILWWMRHERTQASSLSGWCESAWKSCSCCRNSQGSTPGMGVYSSASTTQYVHPSQDLFEAGQTSCYSHSFSGVRRDLKIFYWWRLYSSDMRKCENCIMGCYTGYCWIGFTTKRCCGFHQWLQSEISMFQGGSSWDCSWWTDSRTRGTSRHSYGGAHCFANPAAQKGCVLHWCQVCMLHYSAHLD